MEKTNFIYEEVLEHFCVNINMVMPELKRVVDGGEDFDLVFAEIEDIVLNDDEEYYTLLNAMQGKFDLAKALKKISYSKQATMFMLNSIGQKLIPEEALLSFWNNGGEFSLEEEEMSFFFLVTNNLISQKMGVYYLNHKGIFPATKGIIRLFGSSELQKSLK